MINTHNNLHISVVTPVYGCAAALDELCERLISTLSKITSNYEIILVNDASPDESWELILKQARANPAIKGINLSRNFGQHHAITAGLDFAEGDYVVVMDCDLQDQPEEIAKFYEVAQSGYDIVVGLRQDRQDNGITKLASRVFYIIFSYFTGVRVDNRICNFGIYARNVVKSMRAFREQNRSFGVLAVFVGFKRKEIEIHHAARPHGRSSYNFKKKLQLAIDGLVAHSDKLLRLTAKLGLTMSFFSILYAIWLVLRYFVYGVPLVGWTSLIVSVYFTAGLIIGTIGVLGLYIGKIFDEVKKRPLYIIEATTFDAAAGS